MPQAKSNIIAQLKTEILSLQGYKRLTGNGNVEVALGPIIHSFPNAIFPLSAIHEFISKDVAATAGFIAGIMSSLMQRGGASIWVSSSRTIFPPTLRSFGISPEKIIFINVKKKTDMLWATEEALKCKGLAAVVSELKELNFTDSRRLQLAVEQSGVSGFILRENANNATACVTKWKITSLPSVLNENIPGVGFPTWNIELLKVRNGKPGSWQMHWSSGKLQPVTKDVLLEVSLIEEKERRKAG